MASDPGSFSSGSSSTEALDLLLRDDGRPRPTVAALWSPGGPWRWGLIAAVVVAAVGGLAWWGLAERPSPELSLPSAAPPSTAAPLAPTSTAGEELVVHVAGAVTAPGLVRLPPGSRWADALDAVGGPRPDGDLDRVNLALALIDGDRVYVPAVGQQQVPVAAGSSSAPEGAEGSPSVIDVNSAAATELETLPGIGPSTSAAIIGHRDEHGIFRSVDDLIDVRGIGPAKLEALRDLVTVGGP